MEVLVRTRLHKSEVLISALGFIGIAAVFSALLIARGADGATLPPPPTEPPAGPNDIREEAADERAAARDRPPDAGSRQRPEGLATGARDAHASSEFVDVYARPDGLRVADLHSRRVNYRRPDGTYAPIQNSLVRSREDGFAFKNKAGAFDVRFRMRGHQSALLKLESGNVQFSAGLIGAAATIAATEDNTIVYANVLPGVDLRYSVTGDGVKEDIVLNTRPANDPSFQFRLDTGELAPVRTSDGGIDFIDSSQETRFSIPPGHMIDASGDTSDAVGYEILDTAEGTTLIVTPDADWLADPSRAYPVVVDPTVQVIFGRNEASAIDTYVKEGDNSSHGSDTRLEVRGGAGSADKTWALFKFPVEELGDVHVVDAELGVKVDGTANCSGAADISAYHTIEDWNESAKWGQAGFSDGGPAVASPALDGPIDAACGPGRTNWNVTEAVVDWVEVQNPPAAHPDNYGLQLRPGDVDDATDRDFVSLDETDPMAQAPVLRVIYDVPDEPSALTPPNPTFSKASDKQMPMLQALYSDPGQGDPGNVEFTVYLKSEWEAAFLRWIASGKDPASFDWATPGAPNGPQVVASGLSSQVASGQVATWKVPTQLQLNTEYVWQAVAVAADGARSSQTYAPSEAVADYVAVDEPELGTRSDWPMFLAGSIQLNQATGNMLLTAPAPVYGTHVGSIGVSITYNSIGATGSSPSLPDIGLGAGWRVAGGPAVGGLPIALEDHNLASTGSYDAAEVFWEDGSSTFFDHQSGGVYTTQSNDSSHLTRNSDGTWTLIDASGTLYVFKAIDTGETVAELESAEVTTQAAGAVAGVAQTKYELEPGTGRLERITDVDTGRVLELDWACEAGVLLCVNWKPDGASANPEETWKYYEGEAPNGDDRIGKVRRVEIIPAPGQNAELDLMTMEYDAQGLVTEIKNANDLNQMDPNISPSYDGNHSVKLTYDTATPPRAVELLEGPIESLNDATATWKFEYFDYDHANPGACSALKQPAVTAHDTNARKESATSCTRVTSPRFSGQPVGTRPHTEFIFDSSLHPIQIKSPLEEGVAPNVNKRHELVGYNDRGSASLDGR